MLRPKNQPLLRPNHRKYQQLTPKIPAKTPINYRQRKLAGQSSALPANRTKPKDVNINMQRPTHRLDSIHKEKSALTEEQIKNSRVYKLLLQEMLSLSKRQQLEISKMQQLKKTKQKELSDMKSEQHAIKLQIWQLRNETMELKDSIKQEKQETERLMDELGITEEDLQNQDSQEENQQENFEDNPEDSNEQPTE